jgi:hypothetical protein
MPVIVNTAGLSDVRLGRGALCGPLRVARWWWVPRRGEASDDTPQRAVVPADKLALIVLTLQSARGFEGPAVLARARARIDGPSR